MHAQTKRRTKSFLVLTRPRDVGYHYSRSFALMNKQEEKVRKREDGRTQVGMNKRNMIN